MRFSAIVLALLIAAALFAGGKATDAWTPTVQLISTDATGHSGHGRSTGPRMTSDGHYIAFVSVADNLVPGDTGGSDAFIYDTQAQAIVRITNSSSSANVDVTGVDISDNGRYVLVAAHAWSVATNPQTCPGASGPNCTRLYLLDRSTGVVTQESVNSAGVQADRDAVDYHLSGNGRFILFQSQSPNLGLPGDLNANSTRPFVRDVDAGTTELVTVLPDGTRTDGESSSISTDGRYVSWSRSYAGYVRDIVTDTTTKIIDQASPRYVYTELMSGDGRWVFYDLANPTGTFVYDMQNSTSTPLTIAAYNTHVTDSSDDGRFYVSEGNYPATYPEFPVVLTDRDSDGNGIFDEPGTVTTQPVSVDPGGNPRTATEGSVTNDGGYVTFTSGDCRMALHDTNQAVNQLPVPDVFLSDLNGVGGQPYDPECDDVANPPDNCPNLDNTDQLDTDADGVGNACDNCQTTPNTNQANQDNDPYGDACEQPQCVAHADAWAIVSPDDADCDGFPDTTFDAGRAAETTLGTTPGDACPSTPVANDEATDAWPPDVNDDQKVTGPDILKYAKPLFGSMPPGPPYDVRYDLNADGHITGPDVLKLGPFFGKSCTP